MSFLYPVLLLALVVGPILLAWFKGDQILDRLARNRQHQKQKKRRRTTTALPIRGDLIQILLGVESRTDHIDERIGESLAAFREVSTGFQAPTQTAASTIDKLEKVILARESQFNVYLDIACLQSETIDLLIQEIDLLKKMATVPANIPARPSRPAPAPSEATASDRLLHNLNRARRRREQIDNKLKGLGSQAKTRPTTGTRFDTTLE